MFVGLDLRGGPAVMLDRGGAADMFVGLDPRGSPAVARDLGSAADMFIGLDRRGGSVVARDLGSAADARGPAVTAAAGLSGPTNMSGGSPARSVELRGRRRCPPARTLRVVGRRTCPRLDVPRAR